MTNRTIFLSGYPTNVLTGPIDIDPSLMREAGERCTTNQAQPADQYLVAINPILFNQLVGDDLASLRAAKAHGRACAYKSLVRTALPTHLTN